MRWIWIDRFLEFQRGKSAKALKNLSFAEDYFAEHFPGYPVMPGTLILEGLAQTGGILVGPNGHLARDIGLSLGFKDADGFHAIDQGTLLGAGQLDGAL